MTISRMQEPRQLYGLGSLVKKITRPIKKIVKSPIGKAALGAAALYGVNRFGVPGTGGFGQGAISRLFSGGGGRNLITQASGKASSGGGLGGLFSRILGGAKKGFDGLSFGQKAFLGGGAALSLLPFLTGDDEEEITADDGFDVTPSSIANIRQMARNRDPSLAFLPQEQFVRPGFFSPFAAAEGGVARLGYDEGANQKMNMIRDMLKRNADDDLISEITGATQEEINQVKNSMAGGGIADLPKVRMLEGGMPEIDYRESGGFVPMGKKEKADDVPAMLSKNEFVMTADAVRGMGDGNVEKGAQKMYDQMRQLENRTV
jgi:hypothetical protein